MELKDYQKQKTLLESKHLQELALLARKYALSNNSIKVGDKITDKTGVTIEVEKIGVYLGSLDVPQCVYSGKNLTKAGTVNKRDPEETIYQSNLNS